MYIQLHNILIKIADFFPSVIVIICLMLSNNFETDMIILSGLNCTQKSVLKK